MESDGSYSPLSTVVHGDIALRINTNIAKQCTSMKNSIGTLHLQVPDAAVQNLSSFVWPFACKIYISHILPTRCFKILYVISPILNCTLFYRQPVQIFKSWG